MTQCGKYNNEGSAQDEGFTEKWSNCLEFGSVKVW
jgi:hypothetical protein